METLIFKIDSSIHHTLRRKSVRIRKKTLSYFADVYASIEFDVHPNQWWFFFLSVNHLLLRKKKSIVVTTYQQNRRKTIEQFIQTQPLNRCQHIASDDLW